MMNRSRRCDGVLRRDLLRVGAISSLGLTLTDFLTCRSLHAGGPEPRASNCILLWLDGGPSHLETFDPKPEAPAEVRGPLGSIPTKLAGVAICDQLPRTAAVLDKIALVRSMTSPLGEHNFASHAMLTGYDPTPALVYPGIPAVSSHFAGRGSALPVNIALGRPNAMSGVGYLDASAAAFVIEEDTAKPDFRVKDLSPVMELSDARNDRRRAFRASIDRLSRRLDSSPVGPADPSFEQAYRLISSPAAVAAFDLDRESATTRARYGRHELGQNCLMARRLIEAGTKFVTVTDRGWDTHEDLSLRLKEGFTGGTAGKLPKFDTAYSALIEDLEQRGLLETTLVIAMGEFGRTPKLNPSGGRDHWPRAFSVALAGAGIARGCVVGKTDAHGELPADRPVTPADLVRTIYHSLGINADKHLETRDGRPVQINRDGNLIRELIS